MGGTLDPADQTPPTSSPLATTKGRDQAKLGHHQRRRGLTISCAQGVWAMLAKHPGGAADSCGATRGVAAAWRMATLRRLSS
jgi:hypothetical protein